MKKLSRISAWIITFCLLLSLCACGETKKPASPDTLIIGTTTEITTANRSEYNFDVLSGTLCQLAPVWADENGEYKPLLCDFETADSRTWTLKVRDGYFWHDGEKVTAEDVRFTLEYLDTQTEGGYADRYESIELVDEMTLTLTLPDANPREMANFTTLRIMPKHIYDGVADYTTVSNELANIGCGPYKFKSFDSNSQTIVFEAVENYPDGNPAAKSIIFRLYDNADTMYMALRAGELDMVYKYSGGVDASAIESLAESEKLQLIPVANTANSASLIFNNSKAPFDDVNVRKAVSYAVDYAQFRELFGTEYSKASNAGFIPQGTFGYFETPELERDLNKAKELLSEAGYSESNQLVFTVMVRDDKPVHARYAEVLKNNLAEIGVDVTIDIEEVAVFREKTEQRREQEAVITGLTAFGMAKNQGLASLYMSADNSMGYAQITDSVYAELLHKADSTATLEEYKTVCAEIQNYYAENLPAISLFGDDFVQCCKAGLSGFVIDGTFGILNVQTLLNLKLQG